MAERAPERHDAPGRSEPDEEEREKGSPAQTGRATSGAMGTDEGSGWAPKGDRFGPEGGGSQSPEHRESPPED
jgi:hypothetical protein